MWYLRALAVAAVALPLVVGTGCNTVSKTTYDKDVMAAQKKTASVQKQLDQARKDLKAAQEQLKSKDQVVADWKTAQAKAADEKIRADGLESRLAETRKALDQATADLRTETAKAEKLQSDLSAQKPGSAEMTALKDQLAAKEAELAAAKKALADIAQKLGAAMPEK